MSEPIISVDPSARPNAHLITEEQFNALKNKTDSHEKRIDSHKRLLDWTFGFIVAILVVCFIAVVGFLLDAWRFHAEQYKNYSATLAQEQSQKTELKNRVYTLELKVQQLIKKSRTP